jgi:hypothetical protein
MPVEITLEQTPAGYAVADADEGEQAEVVVREFTSSYDGETFISRLDGLPSMLLGKLPRTIPPSTVDNLLALVQRDLRTTVYVNELKMIARIQAARNIRAGEAVREDDVADVAELTFQGLQIPGDVAVIFLFSVRWAKGLFFDLEPLLGAPDYQREYNLSLTLGSFHAFLTNHSIFTLTDRDWSVLFANHWFPFISLPKSLLKALVGRARGTGALDSLVPQVSALVREHLPSMLERWGRLDAFRSHLQLIQHAADRFRQGDYVSPVAVLFPRIEGLLRSVLASLESGGRATQSRLTGCLLAVGADTLHPYSWLLPARFKQYLEECYFAGFDPNQPAPLSRHSIGHGVASPADFNEKHAALGFLILDQVCYLLGAGRAATRPHE